jgi:hypothetical protein
MAGSALSYEGRKVYSMAVVNFFIIYPKFRQLTRDHINHPLTDVDNAIGRTL